MAEHEPLLTNPATHETAVHVQEYTRFTKLVKWGAIAAFIVGALVVLIIS